MDTDTEDDYASHGSSSDVIRNLLEIANSRPGTNVAKAILAYHESPGLSTLLLLLEEVSKNTDFSTDMRLSLQYYMDEFLRQVSGSSVPRRSVIASAGSVLQYCSKIYGDRVELMYQIVEHQIEALLIADPKKDENNTNSSNGQKDANKPEEPRKRRSKKLTQKEFDPFSYKMEPKKIKIMSDDKRFSRVGFEANKNRNRTIEHMYQDHTPAHLWKYAPIVDPHNPYEQDEKKNYKLFTYHPEPRYNTLLPDIQFDRLNLIKEYVHTNQVNVSETLNRDLSNREYLDKYIALENQMLASRHGERALLKRTLNAEEDVQAKRLRLELENLQKPFMERTNETSKRIRLSDEQDEDGDMIMESSKNETLPTNITSDSANTSEVQLNDSQLDAPVLSSTMAMNDSSGLNSTSSDMQQSSDSLLEMSAEKDGDNSSRQLQVDSGIVADDICDTLPTDNIDQQRLQLLSPKVMVHDILPGVLDKTNLSVRIDAEMLALSGITETLDEIVHIQHIERDVHYSIVRNFLQLPVQRLRKDCRFRLPKEFELFKQARMPAKRQPVPKAPAVARPVPVASPTPSASSLANYPVLPVDQLEFDSELNFLGFRRPTYDSGIDQEETRMANSPADDRIMVDVGTEVPNFNQDNPLSAEIQKARDLEITEEDLTLPEISLGAEELDKTTLNNTEANDVQQHTRPEDISTLESATGDSADNAMALSITQQDSGLHETSMELTTNSVELPPDWDEDASNSNIQQNCNGIDEETDAKIVDWHRRLGPTLEAAHARQNFSIQDLNEEIIAKCLEKDGEATLADVVEDKDPTKLCCYMLSSLLLTNQGNVKLQIDKGDKSSPIEMDQFKMKLISTKRKQLNPEDDIGNLNNAKKSTSTAAALKKTPETAKAVSRKMPEQQHIVESVNVKTVRLIKTVPKASARPEDADSGISSLQVSLASASLNNA